MADKVLHKHLIIRAECLHFPPKSIQSETSLNSSIDNLIGEIGMKVVLPARCIYVGKCGNEGYTGQAGLETSHIAYHIWDVLPDDIKNRDDSKSLIQLDLYTCGTLTTPKILKVIDWVNQFNITGLEIIVMDRAKSLRPIHHIQTGVYNKKELKELLKGD